MITSILIVLKHLIYGGTEKYALTLANTLAEQGVRVTLISGDGPLVDHVSPLVDLHILPISRKLRIKESTENKILAIARECQPQLIHAQCRTALVCSQLARITLQIPLLTHEHHSYDDVDYPFIIDELRNGADHIVTITPYTSKKLITHGLPRNTVTTVLNGVDVKNTFPITKNERIQAMKQLGLSMNDQVILCLSRLETGKGIDKLARGFMQVAMVHPRTKLLIVGDEMGNVIKPFIKELIQKNNLQKRFFLFDGEYAIRKYHAAADIFCYPALCKGMAVMEAMAAGLPVVGKRALRKPFVVEDGRSGLMTDITPEYKIDPIEIAKKLIYLLEHPTATKRMGRAARERIEKKFTLDTMITNMLHLYQEVMDAHVLTNLRKQKNTPTYSSLYV